MCKVNFCLSYRETDNRRPDDSVEHLRWDHADLLLYHSYTRDYLQPLLEELRAIEESGCVNMYHIDSIYDAVVTSLKQCAAVCVPKHKSNFFKFWWSQELDHLKTQAILSNKLWQEVGRPRSGPVYNRRNSDKRAYRLAIRRAESNTKEQYSNHLHDLLLAKQGNQFWKCWNAKFEKKTCTPVKVNGHLDPDLIVNSFMEHFQTICTDTKTKESCDLQTTYENRRSNYIGAPLTNTHLFDAELVEDVICNMHRGKAAGLDGLSAEHLLYCHPLLPCILVKLFNLFLHHGHVPLQFGLSYTVPLLKGSVSSHSKMVTTDDFRGISISPVLSKVFEHCVLRRFEPFFRTSDNQFGFKKNLGCSHAIYTVLSAVNHYITNGSTVNLCAIDISKAFDRMSHFGLFIKLMDRSVPISLLSLLEDWFGKCFTCVKWNSLFSDMFQLTCGIRQGGVLSPYLFAIYVDDIVSIVERTRSGCCYRSTNVNIIMYADDILLLSPSVVVLQELLHVCENALHDLDLVINSKKSVCLRIGPRCNNVCSDIVSLNGNILQWVESIRYLGVYLLRARQFKCNYDNAKSSFYRAFNAVFGRIGRSGSEEVILQLINSKCLPCLLYATEACPVNKTDEKSLEFTMNRVLMKIFQTKSIDTIQQCCWYFGITDTKSRIVNRKIKFIANYCNSQNELCKILADVGSRESADLSTEVERLANSAK